MDYLETQIVKWKSDEKRGYERINQILKECIKLKILNGFYALKTLLIFGNIEQMKSESIR